VRRGLRVLLGSDRDLEVCGEVSNGREVLPLASMKKPDLIIMGLTRIEGLKAIASIRDAHRSEHELTKREIEIVRLLALGNSNKEVAVKLNLSTRTVEGHRNHIMHKMSFSNFSELVRFAIRKRLVTA
jgi:DNA-binding NarL/FixJ family response regulator